MAAASDNRRDGAMDIAQPANAPQAHGLPVLYSFRRCPYAMRARLAIAASGQRCVLREVVLRDKPAALLQASPKGTVPVLVLQTPDRLRVIDQSLDIMRWALSLDDPDNWLAPETGDLSGMLALIAACDTDFKQQLDRYKYPQRHADLAAEAVAAYACDHRDQAARWIATLEARLNAGFLFGARPTLADMAILPFIRQYAHVDAAWFAAQPWPRVQHWLQAWEDSQRFAAVMPKYAPWREGDTPVYFPG